MTDSIVQTPFCESKLLELPWHGRAESMLKIDRRRMNLWVGEPGLGKTTFARRVAWKITGREPVSFQGTPTREAADIWGHRSFDEGRLNFEDGPLPVALRCGRWLVIEDFSLIPVEVRADLLPLRDQPTITNPLTREVIPIPDAFRCVCTSNSEELSCRRNSGVARVLYDGMLILEIPDLSESLVRQFLKHHFPDASAVRICHVIEQWLEYRELSSNGTKAKSYLSYRALSDLIDLLEAGMDEVDATQIALVNKLMAAGEDLFSVAKLKNAISTRDADVQEHSEDGENW